MLEETARQKPGPKRLLAATDLSPRAEKAIARAAQLAKEHSGTLTVLHVAAGESVDDAGRSPSASLIEKDLRRKVGALSVKRNVSMSVGVLSGTPFVEIIRRARQEAADLIVVGAHGNDFMKDLLLGTTAEKIVRKGDRSVLVVKQAAHRSYRRVLVGIDFSDNSRHALDLALRLAPQAELHAVHVYSAAQGTLRGAGVGDEGVVRYQRRMAKDARQQMEEFLRAIDRGRKSIKREVWNGRARWEISKIAKLLRADLVAVGTAGRTGIPYILLGSVAEHVMREAPCDVLVARSGANGFELP